MKLVYKVGDATVPDGPGKKLILHICNDEPRGAWGAGFVLALNKKFGTKKGSPYDRYINWAIRRFDEDGGDVPYKLGQIQYVKVTDDITVVNMLAQSTPGGYFSKSTQTNFAPIRYQSLEECLLRVRDCIEPFIQQGGKINLNSPRIGAGLGGADWNEIEDIIKTIFEGCNVTWTVYDLEKQ